jgi:hypothetical protein
MHRWCRLESIELDKGGGVILREKNLDDATEPEDIRIGTILHSGLRTFYSQQSSSTHAANDSMGGLSSRSTHPPVPRFQITPYSDTGLPTFQAGSTPKPGRTVCRILGTSSS